MIGSETFPALIALIAAGDRDAFSRFYDLTAPLAFGLIRRVLRDPDAAAEVLQEVVWQVPLGTVKTRTRLGLERRRGALQGERLSAT